MSEYMTIEEIKKRFRSEWVLIENPKTNRRLEVQGGTVRFHSKNRGEFDKAMLRLRLRHFSPYYTGRVVPKGMAVVL
jgi:hypothetical protein